LKSVRRKIWDESLTSRHLQVLYHQTLIQSQTITTDVDMHMQV